MLALVGQKSDKKPNDERLSQDHEMIIATEEVADAIWHSNFEVNRD